MIGPTNETYVHVNGKSALALLDTGSQVSCISQHYYESQLSDIPLQPLDTLLHIEGLGGVTLPYNGFIEVELGLPGKLLPQAENKSLMALFLVTSDTRYNTHCPILIGTNIIDVCLRSHPNFDRDDLPYAWKTAFHCMTSNASTISSGVGVCSAMEIPAMSSRVVNGNYTDGPCSGKGTLLIDSSPNCTLPGGLLITPAIVCSEDVKDGIPVHIVNVSSKSITIPQNCIVCHVSTVKVVSDISSDTKQPLVNFQELFPLEELTTEQRVQVYQCLDKHRAAFSWNDWDLGRCDLYQHRIHLKDDKPYRDRYRRIPPALIDEVRDHLQQMVNAGIIRESTSPYASASVFVRKSDGSLRFCCDFRGVNAKTIRDSHYLPRINETFDRLAGSNWFSTLDLKSGYWQIEMHPEDKHFTAFTAGCLGFYEWNRLPMGLCNSASTFQRVIEMVMGPLNLQSCMLYLDDIIVFGDSFPNHLSRLDAVLTRLENANLKLKPSKCCLFKRQIKYLGHILSARGIETDPAKIIKIKEWPTPQDRKQLHRFLGFCGYYRRFIKDFAKLAAPLQMLLRGNSKQRKKQRGKPQYPPFVWGEDQQQAFDNLIMSMSNPPLLAFADFSKPFTVQTDASLDGLGAVISQDNHPIAFASRSLTPAEKRYPAHKLEFLALKWAVCEKFNDYLYGHTFEILTDNNPLTYVMTSAKLDATGLRWVAALSLYNFSIKYKPGKSNVVADALSRLPSRLMMMSEDTVHAVCSGVNPDDLVSTMSMTITSVPVTPFPDTAEMSPEDWSQLQDEDDIIQPVKLAMVHKTRPRSDRNDVWLLWRQRKRLVLENKVLYRTCKLNGYTYKQLVLPKSKQTSALQLLHDDMGHFGREQISDLAKTRFYWVHMKKDINTYIDTCQSCLKRKALPAKAELVNITTSQPMELVSMDFLGLEQSSGGYNSILVLTDHFTRFAMAAPTRNQTAKTTAKVLIDLFVNHYGMPQRLHSDNGANFTSNVISEMCKLLNMARSTTSPYHPSGNGQVERFNRTLLDMLGTLPEAKKSRWKDYVIPLVHAYNCTKNDVTGYSPFELMFGRQPRLPIDQKFGLTGEHDSMSYRQYVSDLQERLGYAYRLVQDNISKSQKASKAHYDQRARGNTLKVGDRVLVKKTTFQEGKHKLANKWEDQVYIIKRKLEDLPVYELVPETGKGKSKKLHRNNLLPIGPLPSETSSASEYIANGNIPDETEPNERQAATTKTAREADQAEDNHYIPQLTEILTEVSVEHTYTPRQQPADSSAQVQPTAEVTKCRQQPSIDSTVTETGVPATSPAKAGLPTPVLTDTSTEHPQAIASSIPVKPFPSADTTDDTDSVATSPPRKKPAKLRKPPCKPGQTTARSASSMDSNQESHQLRRSQRLRRLPAKFRSGDYVLSKQGRAKSENQKMQLIARVLDFLDAA